MTDSLEHDSNEDEPKTLQGKPLPLEPEPHKRALERQAIRQGTGREKKAWNSPDNPAIWTMILGEPFDDDDDEDDQSARRRRELAK